MKIDYLVPMVFPFDPEWQRTWRRACGAMLIDDAQLCARYRTWCTEQLLIQCVQRFMPWLNQIIIILAGLSQVQPWMAEMGVRVVFHADFIPQEYLPTFNSCTIEMFLHRIPDLSERFIYGNDDMFPLSPLQPDDFFRDGLPCIEMQARQYPTPPNQFHMVCAHGQDFVADVLGVASPSCWLHTGHSLAPILKRTCELLWQQRTDELKASITPFRSQRNFNQYIYLWYQYLSGQYCPHVPPRQYVSTKDGVAAVRQAIREAEGILCINDSDHTNDIREFSQIAQQEIKKRLA